MNAIEVADVYKKFKIYHDKGRTLKERLLFRGRSAYEERWALRSVTFSLEKGRALGLVGENGSGKSTLLKLMSRIMVPDRGEIHVKGRVSSLIELGAGFHPDMSGRENIYINASIFGLTKKEIDNRLSDIIAFSELEKFIDSPVRTYSSGMYMRLAFSVAIHVNADVLLIDEILAVGDAAFQQKCFARLEQLKQNGVTIVIVSHSLGEIERICDRSIWLCDGEIVQQGAPKDVHARYLAYMANKSAGAKTVLLHDMGCIQSVTLSNGKEQAQCFQTGAAADVRIDLRRDKEDMHVVVEVSVFNAAGILVTAKGVCMPPGFHSAVLHLSALPFVAGAYTITAAMFTEQHRVIDLRERAASLTITAQGEEPGVVRVPSSWDLVE